MLKGEEIISKDRLARHPLYTALSAGAISIEADVWLYNGTLHVGHEQ